MKAHLSLFSLSPPFMKTYTHTKTDWAVDLYDVTKGTGRSFRPVLHPVLPVPPSGTTSFQTRKRSNPSSASQKAVNRGLTAVCALFWKILTRRAATQREKDKRPELSRRQSSSGDGGGGLRSSAPCRPELGKQVCLLSGIEKRTE